jgi:maleylacetate reductase
LGTVPISCHAENGDSPQLSLPYFPWAGPAISLPTPFSISVHDLKSGHFVIQAQERVLYGQTAEQGVLDEVARYGRERVFVVSTRSLGQLENGPLQRIERALGSRHVGTFGAVRAHSPREDVIAGANAARNAQADALVAIGGGSVIDATKAMQLCLWLRLDTPQALEPYRGGAPPEIARQFSPPANAIRMISVSTTLSASEFTSSAGVTDSTINVKQSLGHRMLVPRSAVLDPAATLDTPPWLLFCTGIRAVDHAIESYCSSQANRVTEATSLLGLELLARSLPVIKARPDDLEARMSAQFGMWQAIAPNAAGVPNGASHGIGYVLGASYNVAHGHTSCVMLPAVLKWNAVVNTDRQRALSIAMGSPDRDASELVAELVKALDQPTSLRDVNIKREDLDKIANRALGYGPVRTNPRPVRTAADVMEILELAW